MLLSFVPSRDFLGTAHKVLAFNGHQVGCPSVGCPWDLLVFVDKVSGTELVAEPGPLDEQE